jgi:hypothetical protein
MKKSLTFLMILWSMACRAGTYTINTDSNTDGLIQNWCFALNAQRGGVMFTQPASASSITAAMGKTCVIYAVEQNMNSYSLQSQASTIAPAVITQMN